MDTLDGTSWDVLIVGTGIQQSLLALSLSRSTKKVLHVDKNYLYGGADAALSLQEAEKWVEKVNSAGWRSPFSNATVTRSSNEETAAKLSASRASAYNLSLAPSLLYTRSGLLSTLVSTRVHEQLEFQAVGSWFIFRNGANDSGPPNQSPPRLIRVPNGREDIFADATLNLRAKGSLMKFIRFVINFEEKPDVWESYRDTPFPEFLSTQFNLPPASHTPLMALGLGSLTPDHTSTAFVLPRIARHLRSMGLFGPGFSALVPRYGGLSEVAQVACRAGAVGGTVYVLDKGIDAIHKNSHASESDDVEEISRMPSQGEIAEDISDQVTKDFVDTDEESLSKLESSLQDQSLDDLLAAAGYSIAAQAAESASSGDAGPTSSNHILEPAQRRKLNVRLEGGEHIEVDYTIGCVNDLPDLQPATLVGSPSLITGQQPNAMSRSIYIVSSPLTALFPTVAEGGTKPAGAVVVFPPGSLTDVGTPSADDNISPVHIVVHTSDTGECPQGQSILYASTSVLSDHGVAFLNAAVKSLLASQEIGANGVEVLWTLHYEQRSPAAESSNTSAEDVSVRDNVFRFPEPPLDTVFDDIVLDNVKDAWQRITGDEANGFMMFQEREGAGEDDRDEDI